MVMIKSASFFIMVQLNVVGILDIRTLSFHRNGFEEIYSSLMNSAVPTMN